jgi:uncharacterized protein (TIGR02147 family)
VPTVDVAWRHLELILLPRNVAMRVLDGQGTGKPRSSLLPLPRGGDCAKSFLDMAAQLDRPVPAEFDDFRAYLRAMTVHLKATDKRFSYRWFARRGGFKSPNFLKLVAEGQRNLTSKSIGQFAKALGLSSRETDGFEALVLLGQATNDTERNRYWNRLKRSVPSTHQAARLQRDQYDVYSKWFALPILELISMPDFREDPEWISLRFRGSISPAQAKRALQLLERVGLIHRNDAQRLVPTDAKLETSASIASLAARNYHRSMLRITEQSLEAVPLSRRNITSLTVNLSQRQYEMVCERVETFRAELLDLIDDAPKKNESRNVYVVGFQSVPLTDEVK